MPSKAILVRDSRGAPLFFVDGDAVRDDAGKIIGEPVAATKETEARALNARASDLMSDRAVLMDLGPGDVVTPSTQAVFPIPVADFVADRVSEVRFVKKDRGYWFQESVADANSLVNVDSGGTGAPPELNPGFSNALFQTKPYAIGIRIPRLLSSNADFDLKAIALHRAVLALRLAREYRVAQLVTTSANWAAPNRITATAKWNGGVTANPLTDMFSALAASALPASLIVMPELAAQYFFQNTNSTAMRDYVQSGGEMPEVLFARAKFTSSGAPAYIWAPTTPANVALVRSHEEFPTTVTFRWLGDSQDGEPVEGLLTRRFYVHGEDCDWFVVTHNDAEVMVANTVGALITGALQ